MNVKFWFNLNSRRIFLFSGILIFLMVLLTLGMHFVSVQVNQHQKQIVDQIKAEFGFPITVDNIKTSWFGLALKISLQNVTVYDPTVPVGFIAIDKIKLYPYLSSILFENEPKFKKLVLQGLKLVVGWNEKNGFSILGLKGESIPTTINYSTFMTLLSKHNSIVIEDSEIYWQGPGIQIKQWWRGKFNWINSKETEWLLTGEQQFQIREDLQLPLSEFKLFAPSGSLSEPSQLGLNIQGRGFMFHCNFTTKEENPWQIACEGDIKNLNIENIHEIYQPKSTDYPVLKWLASSLPNGKITRATIKIYGSLGALQKEGEVVFKEVDFNYTPGWPAIKKASGFVNFKKNTVTVQLQEGEILGSSIETASALIGSMEDKNQKVLVQGTIKSTLEAGLLFLQKSPLQQTIASYIESLDPKGLMDLNLQLTIPLKEKTPIKVEGKLLAKEGAITIPGTDLALSQLVGDFNFTELGLNSSTINAYLNEEPLTIHVSASPKKDIRIRIDKLEIYGLHLDRFQLTSNLATFSKWNIDGPFMKGSLSFPTKNHKNMEINLEHLKIMENNISAKTTADFLIKKEKFPLAFYCKRFKYGNGDFGTVSFNLFPSVYGYAIKDLLFETRVSELTGSGEWHLEKERSYTILEGKMMGINIGETFSQWGYPSAIQEASGYFKYQFKWLKHPFQFNIDIVEGNAELKFDKGRIIGINPGLGRIMGLLNLESIRRRLQLDFSDLLKKGFVFDTMRGKFNFHRGMANTEGLFIDGPSAKIELKGDANLKNKTVDLNMKIIPHIGAGVPIIAAFAAGPAVGAGVWILDKLTGSKINKITQHKYHVTGTWESPTIEEIGVTSRK